jgi:hypothetical protein
MKPKEKRNGGQKSKIEKSKNHSKDDVKSAHSEYRNKIYKKIKGKTSQYWERLNKDILVKNNTEWIEEIDGILDEISKSNERQLFLNILRRVLILHSINTYLFQEGDYLILRSELICELKKLIDSLNIDVQIKTFAEFGNQLMQSPKIANFHKQVPISYHLEGTTCGVSTPKPPSINVERTLQQLIKLELTESISYSKHQILRFMAIVAIHEHAEAKLDYKHCDTPHCPMFGDLIMKLKDNPYLHSLKPCEKHQKLKRFLACPAFKALES